MILPRTKPFGRHGGSFNLTPIIDIVFLLIIFFMLLCQFIVAENFLVSVPDRCRSAEARRSAEDQITTITVMKTPGEDKVGYAVGSQGITGETRSVIARSIAEAIDSRLERLPSDRRIVCLRVDRDIRFCDAQYALAAIAESSAANVRLAALKDVHVKPQPEPPL
jgi:biopolymer transport protein ExbD